MTTWQHISFGRLRRPAKGRRVSEVVMAAINSDVLKGKWQQLKGEARIQWGRLTDDDLDQIQGNIQKLAGKLQERYGYERADADREVDDFVRQHTAATR
jgi:uncharacterized protein YjbJ (UPF0337 family)